MITFYLVRHGQKEETAGDPPLTDVGKKQAALTAEHLKGKDIRYMYASPLKRTLETADIISKELRLPVEVDYRLRERMNWGDKPGETFEAFLEEWYKTDRDREYRPVHGDSSRDAGRRIESLMNTISQTVTKGNVIFVTHGGVIGDFLRNISSEKDLPIIIDKESDTRYIEIYECSVTIVEKENENYTVKEVGTATHLPIPLI
jgi:broad specificity phosphatase PhoE